MPDARRGLAYGVAAYGLWGVFPLYWPLLEPAGAVEILAHRIVWSCVTMGVLVVLTRRTAQLRSIVRPAGPAARRRTLLLVLAAVVVTLNWATFIWAVNNGRVVETSLGYFINPLVTVLMGIVVLGERLRRLQWLAMAVAGLAVLVLTIAYGRPPWVALVLACSFGTYGLAKKLAGVDAIESLTFETLVIAPFALGYLAVLAGRDDNTFLAQGASHALLLVSTGLVTAAPLLLFGAAAVRIPMVMLGLLQYLAPVIQFALGVLWFREEMPAGRWIGFALVWIALVVFTVEALGHRRRQLRLSAEAAAL